MSSNLCPVEEELFYQLWLRNFELVKKLVSCLELESAVRQNLYYFDKNKKFVGVIFYLDFGVLKITKDNVFMVINKKEISVLTYSKFLSLVQKSKKLLTKPYNLL